MVVKKLTIRVGSLKNFVEAERMKDGNFRIVTEKKGIRHNAILFEKEVRAMARILVAITGE